ncbi:MAG: nucleotidyltransferase domain-containing protein [Candidatus Hydrogenedentes bacterium]|nr:nucleotidyltransferase domain-containing protein [Candidatus Hydrogenedentota bacterium]
MVPLSEIEQLAEHIAREFDPDKIVLFGSYADGTATVDSDVDLLVILPFEGRNLDKSVEILVRTNPSFPIDLLARKPEDTERRYRLADPLIRTALDSGIVLHQQIGSGVGKQGGS